MTAFRRHFFPGAQKLSEEEDKFRILIKEMLLSHIDKNDTMSKVKIRELVGVMQKANQIDILDERLFTRLQFHIINQTTDNPKAMSPKDILLLLSALHTSPNLILNSLIN
jgi:Tfp pilus assembly ATPase PilU